MTLRHRGYSIEVSTNGEFVAEIEETEVRAPTFERMKLKIDEHLRGGRKTRPPLNLPALFVVDANAPKIRVVEKIAIKIDARTGKMGFKGDTDRGGYYSDRRPFVPPDSKKGDELRALVAELAVAEKTVHDLRGKLERLEASACQVSFGYGRMELEAVLREEDAVRKRYKKLGGTIPEPGADPKKKASKKKASKKKAARKR